MAATGLLGINPYYKGVAIDFSSKPTQLAIQLQQKEQAKSEAYEKYFMDYEKSLNPAGLAQGESKEFLNKYNRIKENWIKNKQAILNPARYGYDAQAEYSALLKDAVSYIDLGKQATAERKAYNTVLDQARKAGKYIDGDLEVTNNAMKTVGLGYEAPDTSKVEIYDPYDSIDFTEKTWRGIDLPGKIEPEYEMIGGKKTGKQKDVMVESITSDVAKVYDQRAKGYYGSSIGTQKQYNELLKDKELVANLNPIYSKYFNKNIENGAELLSAVGLASKQPKREEKTSFDFPKSWYFNQGQKRQDARAAMSSVGGAGGEQQQGNLFDTLPDATFAGGKITNGTALDKSGSPFNGEVYMKRQELPAQIFSVIGTPASKVGGFKVVFENGLPVKMINPRIGTITRQAMENYQLKYNTEPKKGAQPNYGKNAFINLPNGGFN